MTLPSSSAALSVRHWSGTPNLLMTLSSMPCAVVDACLFGAANSTRRWLAWSMARAISLCTVLCMGSELSTPLKSKPHADRGIASGTLRHILWARYCLPLVSWHSLQGARMSMIVCRITGHQ